MATEQKEVMAAAVASAAAETVATKGATHDLVFTSFSLITDKFDEGIKAAHVSCVRELERLDGIRLSEDELMCSIDEHIQEADVELVALRESAASILATLDGIAATATLASLQASRQQQQQQQQQQLRPSFFSITNPAPTIQHTPGTDKSSFFKQQQQQSPFFMEQSSAPQPPQQQQLQLQQQPINATHEQDMYSNDKGRGQGQDQACSDQQAQAQAQGQDEAQNGSHRWEEEGLGGYAQPPKRSKRARRRNVTIHGPE